MNDIERRPAANSEKPRQIGAARVLVLTAGFGEGHNAAARALSAALNEIEGPGASVVADPLAAASPRLNAVIRNGYIKAINRTPKLWGLAYRWMDNSRLLPWALPYFRPERREVARLVAATRPAVICSSYPAFGFLIDQLARQGIVMPPHYNIVTDSISINSLWRRPKCAGWFLSDEDSAEVMRAAGVEATRLHVCGFPVTPFFSRHAGQLSPPDLAAGATPRILHIVNSGTRSAEATARTLLTGTDWEVTCAVGRDDRMRRRLAPLAAGRSRPSEVLGWTDQIPRLLMTHHAVVSKAGGATTQESIAAQCPMIVSQVVPGQEEGNYELLRRHRAGALAETPDAVVEVLRGAFADRGAVWRRWRSALAEISKPDAAETIARILLAAHP